MVYFDQRGTGRSERPTSGDYALATMVDDIEGLRVHLGVPRLALIAHSFGGVLALEYGARYPDRLAAAVLAAPLWNAPMSCREGLGRLAAARPDVHRRVVAEGEPADDAVCGRMFSALPAAEREAWFQQNMFPNRATLDRQKALDAESGLRNTGEMSASLFRSGLLGYQFAGAARLRAPVLVVSGGRDFQSGPQTLRSLARALPRGRLLEYPEYGHWMFIDDEARFAADVARFLRAAQR
jgi:proline iminopeptidase